MRECDDDGFDSMTRSTDDRFHDWFMEFAASEDGDFDLDRYEDMEQCWSACKAQQAPRQAAPSKQQNEYAARILSGFTLPDTDNYWLAGIIYKAMNEQLEQGDV